MYIENEKSGCPRKHIGLLIHSLGDIVYSLRKEDSESYSIVRVKIIRIFMSYTDVLEIYDGDKLLEDDNLYLCYFIDKNSEDNNKYTEKDDYFRQTDLFETQEEAFQELINRSIDIYNKDEEEDEENACLVTGSKDGSCISIATKKDVADFCKGSDQPIHPTLLRNKNDEAER